MFNYNNLEAVRLLTEAVPAAEELVKDALDGRLTPDQMQQVLGICGASSPLDALQAIRRQKHALIQTVVINEPS